MSTAPKLMTLGQMKDLISAVTQAFPTDLSFDQATALLSEKKKLGDRIRTILSDESVVVKDNVTRTLTWQQAIQKAYALMGMEAEYAEFCKEQGVKEIPGRWVIPMVKGLSCSKIIISLQKSGSGFWSYYDDLDKKVTHNDRDPNRDGSYICSFLAVMEADEENKGKSANQLKEEKHQGITLMERLLLGLIYFLMTGKHLDIKKITLCAGSRYDFGYVPSVDWGSDTCGVGVCCCRPSNCYDGLRSRSAVSLPAEPSESEAEQAIA